MLLCNQGKKRETQEEEEEFVQCDVDRLQNDKGRKTPTEIIGRTDKEKN